MIIKPCSWRARFCFCWQRYPDPEWRAALLAGSGYLCQQKQSVVTTTPICEGFCSYFYLSTTSGVTASLICTWVMRFSISIRRGDHPGNLWVLWGARLEHRKIFHGQSTALHGHFREVKHVIVPYLPPPTFKPKRVFAKVTLRRSESLPFLPSELTWVFDKNPRRLMGHVAWYFQQLKPD